MGTSPRGLSLSQAIWFTIFLSPRTHTLIACRLRNINLMIIDYALRPHLSVPANPRPTNVAMGILGFTATRILTWFITTHVCILTCLRSTLPYSCASAHRRRSPTTAASRRIPTIRGFGTGFNRQSFSAQDRSMSQLLRFV